MRTDMYLMLLGAPGVGKGTQSKMLEEKFSMIQLSTGDILRSEIAKGSKLGKLAKAYIEEGNLVPDDVMIDIIGKELDDRDLIFDGFPRTLDQAKAFDNMLEKRGKRINKVLNIFLDDRIIVGRLSGRMICRNCGSSFHLQFAIPKTEGFCDDCNGELYQRPDDRPESITERLSNYHSKTEPLINFYKKKGILVEIDGDKKPSEVFEDLVKVISKEVE